MSIPPKGHPDRPLRMAARSMAWLGFALIGLCALAGITIIVAMSQAPATATSALPLIAVAVYLVPGIGFLVCWHYLKQHKAWAAIVGIVLAGVALLVSLLGLVGVIITLLTEPEGSPAMCGGAVLVLVAAALVQLIVHLSQSFKAIRIREMAGPQGFGFQPVYAQPVINPYAPPSPPTAPRDFRYPSR